MKYVVVRWSDCCGCNNEMTTTVFDNTAEADALANDWLQSKGPFEDHDVVIVAVGE